MVTSFFAVILRETFPSGISNAVCPSTLKSSVLPEKCKLWRDSTVHFCFKKPFVINTIDDIKNITRRTHQKQWRNFIPFLTINISLTVIFQLFLFWKARDAGCNYPGCGMALGRSKITANERKIKESYKTKKFSWTWHCGCKHIANSTLHEAIKSDALAAGYIMHAKPRRSHHKKWNDTAVAIILNNVHSPTKSATPQFQPRSDMSRLVRVAW